ncbi:DUF1801 domain-containing protein [Ekhidna sp.]|uniref:DUF1801 domain-containing protein n=1 Tax=Ekhidna sp. TaxID=2608089 RepID=UPI003513C4D3
MKNLQITSDPIAKHAFATYPLQAKEKLAHLRKLILETADEIGITDLEETLKWGEPSYLSKHGSTIRIDWKEKKPDQYAMYFKCTSKLVPSFQLAFGDLFNYETTRAIVFKLNDEVPEKELKECIKAALRYHKVKKLPLLGLGVDE